MYRSVHIRVCVCVFTLCNTQVIMHAVTRHVDVSSDGEAVCSLLFIVSLSTFLRNREYDQHLTSPAINSNTT